MYLIIGLGNPGLKYEKTRHNLGFMALDSFVKNQGFTDFKLSKKLKTSFSQGTFNKEELVIAKPQTFMNNSGQSVKLLMRNYKIKTENLIVVHDDIDLSLGKIKIAKNRSSAGHKGVESIIREIKSKNFVRIRLGIRPDQLPDFKSQALEKFVLKSFTKEEKNIIKKSLNDSLLALKLILKQGLEKAMNKFN